MKSRKEQINDFIGKKVKVFVSYKPILRILHEDEFGIYVDFKGVKVPCKPDKSDRITHFVALDPVKSTGKKLAEERYKIG